MESTTLIPYLTATKAAGIPRDQSDNFVDAEYTSLPKMLAFHAAAREADRFGSPNVLGIGGARGPGKSHACLAQVGLDDCQRRSRLKWLFLRKIRKAAAESMEDLVTRVFSHVQHEYKPSLGRVVFPNGSRILMGGFKDESDIDNYIGIDYDGIVVEEANALTQKKIDMIQGSLRTSRTDWRPRMYLSFNPGDIGHAYIKRTFVTPYRMKQENSTRFFPSNYKDNPFLNPDYVLYLEHLEGPLGKAWRDGDFDVFEGMALPTWNYTEHVIPPCELPSHWLRWRAVDGGYAKPFCCLWFAKNPDTGRIIVYRELYQALLSDRQQARQINDMTLPNELMQFTFADPALWARKNVKDVVTTTADEYRAEGILLTPADNDRLNGKRKVDRILGSLPDGEPGIQFFSTCVNAIRTLPELPFDKVRVEDVDTHAEDHCFDAIKYGLTNYRLPAAPSKQMRREEKSPLMAYTDIL
jgi:PBSX family phage terminase large subunit